MLLCDLKRNAYDQYKKIWLKEHDENCETFVCFNEFIDNEFESESLMKHYLSEDLYKEYLKAFKFNKYNKIEELKKVYSFMCKNYPKSFDKEDLDCIYEIYQNIRYEKMFEDILDYLIEGGIIDINVSNLKIENLQDNLIDTIIEHFEHHDPDAAAKSILNFILEVNGTEFSKTEEYKRMKQESYGYAVVLFNNCFITPVSEFTEEE